MAPLQRIAARPPRINVDRKLLSPAAREALALPRGIRLGAAIALYYELRGLGYMSDFADVQKRNIGRGEKWAKENASSRRLAETYWIEVLGDGIVEEIEPFAVDDALTWRSSPSWRERARLLRRTGATYCPMRAMRADRARATCVAWGLHPRRIGAHARFFLSVPDTKKARPNQANKGPKHSQTTAGPGRLHPYRHFAQRVPILVAAEFLVAAGRIATLGKFVTLPAKAADPGGYRDHRKTR